MGATTERATLLELAHRSDPAVRPDKPDYYLAFYDEIFAPMRGASLNVLEVGVQRGGSTLLLANYFSRAPVLGVDIQEPPPAFYEAVHRSGLSDRIKVVMVSQDDESGLKSAIESYFGEAQLDLVIDDASHYYPETRSTFVTIFGSYLKPGGTYIIEDWGCGYWPLWHDGHPDGHHGLPRLVKELVDLVALPDRTKLWGDQRVLPVDTELPSPISRALLLNSVAAFVRSEAAMPSPQLLWGDESHQDDLQASRLEILDVSDPHLGLRSLLRALPTAVSRSITARWERYRSRISSRSYSS